MKNHRKYNNEYNKQNDFRTSDNEEEYDYNYDKNYQKTAKFSSEEFMPQNEVYDDINNNNSIVSKELSDGDENNYPKHISETENNLKIFESKFKKFQENTKNSMIQTKNEIGNYKNYIQSNSPPKDYSQKLKNLQIDYAVDNNEESLINESGLIYQNKRNNLNQTDQNFKLKRNTINLEAENTALKQKIHELSQYIKNQKEEQQLKDNEQLNYKLNSRYNDNDYDEKIEDFQRNEKILIEKNEKLMKVNEKYLAELQKKDNQLKKLSEDRENYEYLKKENHSLIIKNENKDKEIIELTAKIIEFEKSKSENDRKINNYEAQIRVSRGEYDTLSKLLQSSKKQIETLSNKVEELKADNYNLKQENSRLMNDKANFMSKNSQNETTENFNMNKKNRNQEFGNSKYLQPKEDFDLDEDDNYQQKYKKNEEVLMPNKNKGKYNKSTNNKYDDYENQPENKVEPQENHDLKRNYQNQYSLNVLNPNEKPQIKQGKRTESFNTQNKSSVFVNNDNDFIKNIEMRLIELNTQKKNYENEIFKLPEKQKSQIQINKRKTLEDSVTNIDKEINSLRVKLRELNKK